jgi:predicted GIY-YIG superfamily endonuclease
MDEDGLIVSIKLHNDHSGYVYLIEAENGLVKIGRTEDVERRLSSINSASPICVTLLHSEFVKDAVEMERVLHDRFQSKRMRGEWFRLSESDVDEAIHLLAEARSPV